MTLHAARLWALAAARHARSAAKYGRAREPAPADPTGFFDRSRSVMFA